MAHLVPTTALSKPSLGATMFNKQTRDFDRAHSLTRYTHAHQVPHAEHVESSKWRSSKRERRRRAVLRLSVHAGSASEVNRSVDDAQVVSRHRLSCLSSFVEQLTFFHTSGLILASSQSISSTSISMLCAIAGDGIMSGTCQRYHKPVYFNRKPVTDNRTYIHTSTVSD